MFNNEKQAESDAYYLDLLVQEGAIVTDPSEEVLAGFREKAVAFYDEAAALGWSEGLYETVMEAMGK